MTNNRGNIVVNYDNGNNGRSRDGNNNIDEENDSTHLFYWK